MPQIRRVVSVGAALATAGAVLLAWRRQSVGRFFANMRHYSAPSVGAYESHAPRFLGGFYERVARETADLATSGRVLDVGSGTGHLAVALARAYPGIQVVGVDVSPEMVGKAREVAQRAGVGSHVLFEQGDVGALPFPDASFDAVLSTLSMHHWPDPARGLAEIHRVLRPGAVARIYDVADWVRRVTRHAGTTAVLTARGPFGEGKVEGVYRLGPIPILQRIELRKGSVAA